MNPAVLALVAGITLTAALAAIEALLLPVLVAVIMGGPAWLTAKRAREEGLSVASLLVDRLERIEGKMDDFHAWRIAHDVRLGLGAEEPVAESFVEDLLEVLRQEDEPDEA